MASDVTQAEPSGIESVPAPAVVSDPDSGPKRDEGIMAFTTLLNGQVTDAVAQADVITLGDAPAQAMASLYQAGAQALAVTMMNAIAGQQGVTVLSHSVLTACLTTLRASSVTAAHPTEPTDVG